LNYLFFWSKKFDENRCFSATISNSYCKNLKKLLYRYNHIITELEFKMRDYNGFILIYYEKLNRKHI